ncbi:MAG: hypothetical protein E6K80_13080 [Candidatus Eisenbacteria bacterium]|uniref:Uncharacterized protein n=1 Tax=Eiseniibacteriota bacterium TaxID=2212470 RepID=A0A538TZJ6_UNCEI|nr:MAG: hypothetical protein E6K80_13080 [Candidatus Eisenbacteria bacterium]
MSPRAHRRRRLARAITRANRVAPAPIPVPLLHPAMMAACLALAASLIVSASFRLFETDLWQHLVMGRAIWERGLPRVNLWTWPQYGAPAFLSSWGFRALLWPLWSAGGVSALFAWRWVTTLGVFAILLATARTMGARGFSALIVLAWAALGYRLRGDVRPETLGSLLLAAEVWLLERRRRVAPAPAEDTGADRARRRGAWAIPALVCAWANAHISVYLAFVVLAFHGLDAVWAGRVAGDAGRAARARARDLAWIALASLGAAMLNPFGWEVLRQPIEFALVWSHDPLVRTIGELQPLSLKDALAGGLPVWALLALLRTRRRGLDVTEVTACAFATALALSSQRFSATYWILAAPFVARDLEEWITARRWPAPRLPLGARAALAIGLIAMIGGSTWRRPDLPLSLSIDPGSVPERACDFIEAHGIRGRGLNDSSHGGYQAFRFWPDRWRLPFLSSQPEYTPAEDRRLFLSALRSADGWRAFDAKHHFDYLLLERDQAPGDSLLDFLDHDPRFALVFADDAAELLLRRDRFRAVVDSFAYRVIPAGRAGRYALGPRCQDDLPLRRAAELELDRMIAGSPSNAGANHLRGFMALMDGDLPGARANFERALAIDPLLPNLHDLQGTIALQQGRWRDAIRELDAERRLHQAPGGLFFRTAVAWQQLGRWDRARAFYRRELARDPGYAPASDSLAALDARGR